MTKADMEQLKKLPYEIKAIEETLKNPEMEYVNIFYKDYRTGKGIPKRRTEIGVDEQEIKKLGKRLRRKAETLGRLIVKAEELIDAVEDSETRTILRLYYINGQTLEAIAKELNFDRSTIGKKLDRFWSINDNSHNSH